VDIPSFIVNVGDTVELTDKGQKFVRVQAAGAGADKRPLLSWLEVDRDKLTGKVKATPVREELNEPVIDEQLVVEYYSR
jgi:small subunit ribosomal protein S4